MLRLAIVVLGVGFLLGAGGGLLIKITINNWGQAALNDNLRSPVFAAVALGVGSACGYGVSYYRAKLRKRAAK